MQIHLKQKCYMAEIFGIFLYWVTFGVLIVLDQTVTQRCLIGWDIVDAFIFLL